LARAEAWLREGGCLQAHLGGGLRPFAPGLPVQLASRAFFQKRGYQPPAPESRVWDVARSLEGYTSPGSEWLKGGKAGGAAADIHPVQSGETARLEAFLAAEFPGRWHFEFQEHLRLGGRLSDILILLDPGTETVAGFCLISLEDSLRPIERFYPHGLPRPWGQLGPIGVGAAWRGQGLGAGLLDAGLRYLAGQGVAGCVIDWTDLPGFYQKFGFQLHREYLILTRSLD
jgi:predicted N-acetyltransferase YhbS